MGCDCIFAYPPGVLHPFSLLEEEKAKIAKIREIQSGFTINPELITAHTGASDRYGSDPSDINIYDNGILIITFNQLKPIDFKLGTSINAIELKWEYTYKYKGNIYSDDQMSKRFISAIYEKITAHYNSIKNTALSTKEFKDIYIKYYDQMQKVSFEILNRYLNDCRINYILVPETPNFFRNSDLIRQYREDSLRIPLVKSKSEYAHSMYFKLIDEPKEPYCLDCLLPIRLRNNKCPIPGWARSDKNV